MHAAGERQQHQKEDEKEFSNVNEHASEGYLERSEVRVRLEQVDNPGEAEHVRHGEQTLCDEGGVASGPEVTWYFFSVYGRR